MRWLGLLALLVAPKAADAGHHSCGGGGGGHSPSHSSSTAGLGYGDRIHYVNDTTSTIARSSSEQSSGDCTDDTDVVGYRHCTPFGAWATNLRLPRLFLELGGNARTFGSGLANQSGTVTHGAESFSYRTVMAGAGGTDTAVTTALRLGVGLSTHVYTGAELEVGGLVSPAAASAEMTTTGAFGSPSLDQRRGLVAGALGLAGFRQQFLKTGFALEAAGGLRTVTYRFDSAYHDCEQTTSITTSRGVVEARLRAEIWLTPWLTGGALVGANMLSRGDWMSGLYLGVHSRAYAGQF